MAAASGGSVSMSDRSLSTMRVVPTESDGDTVFPTLDRINAPHGALASATQRKGHFAIVYPRGFNERRNVVGGPFNTWAPMYDSAMWFKQMHAVVNSATDLLSLIVSEGSELALAAGLHQACASGLDGSLKPRMVAVWVQVSPSAAKSCVGNRIIDAMAHWSMNLVGSGDKERPIASTVRLTVVADTDAIEFATKVADEHTCPIQGTNGWTYRVTVRWVDAVSKRCRSETHTSCMLPITADAALDEIQKMVVRMVGAHGVPFPTTLMRPVTSRVPHVAYARGVESIGVAFHNLTSGKPSVTLDSAASSGLSGPLENTGVVVRLCQRTLKEDGFIDPSSFHGALLSFGAAKKMALAFSKEGAASGTGLRLPLGMQEESMGLHVCAVQAELTPLHDRVTLFGPMGKPGHPIHPPNSSVWVESAAIRPVDSKLLGPFALYPCAKSSLIPGNPALAEPFKRFFMLASILYTSLDSKNQTNLKKSPTFSSGADLDLCGDPTDRLLRNLDVDEVRTERFMLAAFRVDLQSSRTTIGDAYAYLFDAGAPQPVVSTLLHAAGRLGVCASLSRAMQMCSDVIRTHNAAVDPASDTSRLKRLAEVALDALTSEAEPPTKRASVVPIASSQRIRRMIAALGLKRDATACVLRAGSGQDMADKAASRLMSAMVRGPCIHSPPQRATDLIHIAATKPKGDESSVEWTSIVISAVRRAASMAMVAVKADTGEDPVCFAIVSQAGSGEVCIERVTPSGMVESSLDAMVGEAQPGVFIVQSQDEYKLRITATIPS